MMIDQPHTYVTSLRNVMNIYIIQIKYLLRKISEDLRVETFLFEAFPSMTLNFD